MNEEAAEVTQPSRAPKGGVLWVLFWPLRAWMKRNRPEGYAASQHK